MSVRALEAAAPARSTLWLRLARSRGLITAIVVFLALLLVVDAVNTAPLSYFDVSFLASGGASLAIAAFGETLVILVGGFDLSAGAVLSLVNVVLAASMSPTNPDASVVLWTLAGVGVGAAVGAFNGLFIAFLRLQPIVVTLSTMFIVQGVTLLVMEKPGGFVSPSLGTFFLGDAIPNKLPMPIVLLLALVVFWLWLKNTRFGTAIYAVGSDADASAATGVRVMLVRFGVYVLAGGFYGLAGVFISAQTGSGDPLVGNPLLLVDLRRGRCRRDAPWRRSRRPDRLDRRRLHPDDCRQHSPGAERLGLLLEHRRGTDPFACGAGVVHFARFDAGQSNPQRARPSRRLAKGHAAAPDRRRRQASCDGGFKRKRNVSLGRDKLVHASRSDAALRAPSLCLLPDRARRDAAHARTRHQQLALLGRACRSLRLPRDPGARPGDGYPDRRTRPLRALDHRFLRHPACRHGARLRRRAPLCAAGRVGAGLSHWLHQRRWRRRAGIVADRGDAWL